MRGIADVSDDSLLRVCGGADRRGAGRDPGRAIRCTRRCCWCCASSTARVIWLLLDAEFLGIVLVLVYVGAVMVLFLFVVMMLDVNLEELRKEFVGYWPLTVAVAGFVVFAIINVIVVKHLGGMALRRRPGAARRLFQYPRAWRGAVHPLRLPGAGGRAACCWWRASRPSCSPCASARRQAPGHRQAGGGARQGPGPARQNGRGETTDDHPDACAGPVRASCSPLRWRACS